MSMDRERWNRVQALFHEALERPDEERASFLAAACAGDPALEADVMAMLVEDARRATLLDGSLGEVADTMLGVPLAFSRFGPYRITKLLGEGGMAVVYLAERDDLGSRAAIKILRDAWLSPARKDRFAAEQRTLAQLNHPAIARLYDADTLPDGTPWFAMEYVEGIPLTEYCRKKGSSISDRLRLFRSVCEAVQHAHGHAIIHRDLKPSNILVKDDGTVRLLDFGIAKHIETLSRPEDQTRTGLRLMTPAYAAPEQIRGGPVGIYTDVYALGVVLYELLSGRLPYDLSMRTPGEVEASILEREPERPSAAARGLAVSMDDAPGVRIPGRRAWDDLDVLCLKAMHKDPERRYQTVEALSRDVERYLSKEPLEARPDTVGYRLGKFLTRNWQAATAAAVTSAVLIALVFFYTVRLAAARNDALAEAARTERIQRFTMSLFEGGDEAIGPADSLRVITLVDRGLQEARSLEAEPAIQADLFQTLGGIYRTLGNLPRADSLLSQALSMRTDVFGPEHPNVARSLLALGVLRFDQADFDESERLIRRSLEIRLRAQRPDLASIARARTALGRVLDERGEFDEATRELDEAVRLQMAAGADRSALSETLYELANTHFYAGRYEASDSLNQVVMAINVDLYGDRHPSVAENLINLGASQFDRGEYVGAEGFYRRALDITEAWYGEDHHRTAADLTMLGRALSFQGRHDEAVEVLGRALAIQTRVYGPVHPRIASALNELGNVAYAQDRYAEAEAHFTRMADIYRSVHGDRHFLVGIALSNLASVYMERAEYGRAEQLYRQVVELFVEAQGPDHMNTGIARIKLGRTLVRQGRYAEAEQESLSGYEIVSARAAATVSWLRSARIDLAVAYDSLHRPDRAEHFRAEQARVDGSSQEN